MAGTRAEVRKLNQMAQEARQEAGALGQEKIDSGGQRFYRQDQVLFTEKNTRLGVQNGDRGTIISIDEGEKTLRVKLANGEAVTVSLDTYKSLSLGYASTTHKGQGATVDYAFALVGGKMADLHLSYVQASRAREDTRLYTERRYAGDTMEKLSQEMSRERQKDLAVDVLRQQEAQEMRPSL